ncbi:hypothetical protein KM176_06375 [Pseudooceanicola sp. CBS1P-1]|uniref:hypothetical protein n=1 Tax=Pseudooceanicola endophyticus TaxID=2841273 RepID=UPI001C0156B4|nr:hypothetical protein [Pseudooceanicola endophyticus]MBT9383477.1 hypothetical protein [Pseudooceanicola endophyticus]
MASELVPQSPPDWAGLYDRALGSGLLITGPFSALTPHLRGRVAYVATPGQPGRATSRQLRGATRWSGLCTACGIAALSPQVLAAALLAGPETGLATAERVPGFWSAWSFRLLLASGAVLVPPVRGWRQAPEVWGAASWAIRHNVTLAVVAPGPEGRPWV